MCYKHKEKRVRSADTVNDCLKSVEVAIKVSRHRKPGLPHNQTSIMLDDFAKLIARTMTDNSLDSCARWAEHKIWMPKPHEGPLRWSKFPWQPTILNCQEAIVSVMKAAQMGFSVTGLIKALYKVDQEREDVLYVLPTRDLASDFAKARLDALVALSPEISGMFTGSNNVGLKTTKHHSHIFIRGSIAESGLVSVPVGTAIVDEFDRCNPAAMALVKERTAAYEKKQFFGLSTPTTPEYGINEEYLKGTQEHFMFKCPGCGHTIELTWPECVEIHGDCATSSEVHDSFYHCPRKDCLKRLDHHLKYEWLKSAKWEATAKAFGHRSFWINQMYGPAITPGELTIAYFEGLDDEKANIQWHNQKLGVPYLMKGGKVTDAIINACIGNHRMDDPNARPQDCSRMITMGVDVGTFLDVCIRESIYTSEPGNEPHLHSIAKVLWQGRLPGSDFHGLDALLAEWQVLHCCIDFQPETELAKSFARRCGTKCISLVQYREGVTGDEIKKAEDENGVVILTVDWVNFMDRSLGRMHKGQEKIILPQDLAGFAREHYQAPNRTYILDKYGKPKAYYVNNKPDHQAHALLLSEVAFLRAYSRSTGRPIRAGENLYHF